jgi:hypothetical protein
MPAIVEWYIDAHRDTDHANDVADGSREQDRADTT